MELQRVEVQVCRHGQHKKVRVLGEDSSAAAAAAVARELAVSLAGGVVDVAAVLRECAADGL